MDKQTQNTGTSNGSANSKGGKDTENARTEAANDIKQDPDTVGMDRTSDLDEGELARKDNSND